MYQIKKNGFNLGRKSDASKTVSLPIRVNTKDLHGIKSAVPPLNCSCTAHVTESEEAVLVSVTDV